MQSIDMQNGDQLQCSMITCDSHSCGAWYPTLCENHESKCLYITKCIKHNIEKLFDDEKEIIPVEFDELLNAVNIEDHKVRILALMTNLPYEKIINAQINSDEWLELTRLAKYLDEFIKKEIAFHCQTKKN